MKLKKIVQSLAVAGSLALASGAANALVIMDAWQLDFSALGIPSVTTNIGHLNLSGGTGTIDQQLGANGLPDAGETFTEFGAIFSASVTPENVVGQGDTGSSLNYMSFACGGCSASGFARPDLRISFSGLAGKLTNVDANGAVTYAFTPGVGTVTMEVRLVDPLFGTALSGYFPVAGFGVISPSGGVLGNFLGGAVPNGQTDALAVDFANLPGLFRNSAGVPLVSMLGIPFNPLLGILHTDNKLLDSDPGTPGFQFPTVMANGDGTFHTVFNVGSDGSFDIARLPEPGTLALLGAALFGFGAIRRNAKQSQA